MTESNERPVPEQWYRDGFNALYPIVYAHRTVEAAEPEVQFAAGELGLGVHDRVLDLCCGNSRHMAHLKRIAPEVTGLDFSAALLAMAKRMDPAARLVRADMRAIPFDAAFDVVTNFFTSFGYFFTREENLRVVREVARALKPGGRFFIDYLNPRHVEKTLVPENTRRRNEFEIRERRWIDSVGKRVNKSVEVHGPPENSVGNTVLLGAWTESVRLYEEGEFRALLAEGGLIIERLFGNYEGADVSDEAPRMIAVGRKE